MNDAPVEIGVQNNFSNPVTPIKSVPLPVLGVVSFLDHNWGERFSSAAGYSMVNIDNSNAQNPSDFHQGYYALANLIFHPVPKVTMGGEFQFGRRVNFSDGFNDKWNKLLTFYSKAAGEKLTLIEDVYKSEAATNTGNKALSMFPSTTAFTQIPSNQSTFIPNNAPLV
jgi:hypothetical protein